MSANVSKGQLGTLDALFNSLPRFQYPTETQMDQYYAMNASYASSSGFYQQIHDVLIKLGSSDDNLGKLKQWEQWFMDQDAYKKASPTEQNSFKEIFGLNPPPDPLKGTYDMLTQWAAGINKNSPIYKIIEQILAMITPLGKYKSLDEAAAAINKALFESDPKHDIFWRTGVDVNDLKQLSAYFLLKLPEPQPTQMDQKYNLFYSSGQTIQV